MRRSAAYRPPQYRRVMIPLAVLRGLDCVLEETKDEVIALHKKLWADKKHDPRPSRKSSIISSI
jgi:type I restriction enzyme M protein